MKIDWGKSNVLSSSPMKRLMRRLFESERTHFVWTVTAIFSLCSSLACAENSDSSSLATFHIPQQSAETALLEFAEQADLTLVVRFDEVSGKTANELIGEYSLEEGIAILLEGTGLRPTFKNALVLNITTTTPVETEGGTMKTKTKKGILAGIAAIFTASGAAAQDGGGLLEEIVVTAQKREQALDDVPVALTVLSSAQIDDTFSNGIESLQAVIPSLTFRKGNTNRNSGNFLRGIGTISFSIAAEPSVSTVVDGVVLSRSGQAFTDLYDLERVEVLRGPQGTLFGKNASAGVINIVTKGPTEELETNFDFSVFEGNERRMKASVSGPVTDNFRARVTAFTGDYDGAHTNVFNGGDLNGYNRKGARAILDYDFSDAVTSRTILEYYDSSDNCCIELVADRDTPISDAVKVLRTVDNDLLSITDNRTAAASFNLDWDLDSHVLTSITSYSEWDNVELADRDFRSQVNEQYYTDGTITNGRLTSTSDSNNFQQHEFGPQQSDTFTQEIRLANVADGPLEYLVGVYYSNTSIDRTFERSDRLCVSEAIRDAMAAQTLNADTAAAGGVSPDNLGCEVGTTFIEPSARAVMDTEFENSAVFGNLTYNFSDRFRVLAGLRYTRDEVSYNHRRDGNADHEALVRIGGAAPGIRSPDYPELAIDDGTGSVRRDGVDGDGSDSQTNTNVSGKFGVQFDLNDNWMLYGTYAQGYKGPAFNISFSMREAREPAVDEETSDAFEVGLKGTLWGNTFVGIAAYTTDIEGFQQNSNIIQNGTISSNLTNAGTVETTGVEIDFRSVLSERLSIYGGLALMPTVNIQELNCSSLIEFARVSGDPDDQADADACLARSDDQERLALAPDVKANLALSYTAPLSDRFNWHFNINGSYQDEVFSNDREDPLELLDARALFDASIGISNRDGTHRLTLIAKNLTDENYATQVISSASVPSSEFPSGRALRYQIPREADRYFGLNYRASF